MIITPELADRLYSVLVQSIDSPNDYRRWAFVHGITQVHMKRYLIDSCLGLGAQFCIGRPPVVVCDAKALNQHRRVLVQRTNAELAKAMPPKRIIAIQAANKPIAVPVLSPEISVPEPFDAVAIGLQSEI